jgi:UDP-glucose-4-epimerase GalE
MRIGSDHKILVTGGAGYVGSHAVHRLIENGVLPEQIIVFDNLVYGHPEFLPPGVALQRGDLLCKEDIRTLFINHPITEVLHFAAYAYVGESMALPGKYFENNIMGGINLLEAMVQARCKRIIFSSSCAAYGAHGDIALSEETESNPINPYGHSKLIFESILAWYHRIHGIRSISLRYFNAAGAAFGIGERHSPETHLIPLLIQTAMGSNPVFTILGDDYDTPDGTCVRDFIHVADLADAHLEALRYLYDRDVCEVINLGSGQGYSVRQLLTMIERLSGGSIPTRVAPRRPGDPAVLVAGNGKAGKLLHWKPQRSLAQMLESAWHWHRRECGQPR